MDTETKTGAELIAAERQRQIESEGWTPDHDDEHDNGELAYAGAAYAVNYANNQWKLDEVNGLEKYQSQEPDENWPEAWGERYWKPKDRIRDLVRAGAFLAAEIDRLQRQASVPHDSDAGNG